ncbi:MAG: hypothetical protein K2X77_23820 [Candidatus Obscuribacterales bacterium]|jgi:hypothetical protein|nr:hypothetical protein [Candidatus Obscuribacterales bacterium]
MNMLNIARPIALSVLVFAAVLLIMPALCWDQDATGSQPTIAHVRQLPSIH